MNASNVLFIICFCTLAFASAYDPWFHPQKFLDDTKKKAELAEKSRLYKLQAGYINFIVSNPKINIWYSRIMSLILLFLALIVFLALRVFFAGITGALK